MSITSVPCPLHFVFPIQAQGCSCCDRGMLSEVLNKSLATQYSSVSVQSRHIFTGHCCFQFSVQFSLSHSQRLFTRKITNMKSIFSYGPLAQWPVLLWFPHLSQPTFKASFGSGSKTWRLLFLSDGIFYLIINIKMNKNITCMSNTFLIHVPLLFL